jgi:hypothetical protein
MVNFNSNFSNNSRKTASSKNLKNCIISLILFSCFFLGIFWVYSLIVLIADFPLKGSQLSAGSSLLSYTSTIYEYINKIPGLVYRTDERFMDQIDKKWENEDILYDKYYPKLFEFENLIDKWNIYDTSPQVY